MKSTILPFAIASFILVSGCTQQSENEARNKKSVIEANEQILNKGNIDHVHDVFTDDYGGEGPEYVANFATELREAFPDIEVEIDPFIAEGDLVAWKRTNTGTHSKSYRGYPATGDNLTWHDLVISKYTSDGMISEEWFASDFAMRAHAANGITGTWQYLPPLQGQSIIDGGYFTYLYGPMDGSEPMVSEAGTYTFSGDTVKNIITHSTDSDRVGTSYSFIVKSWSGDTAQYQVYDAGGRQIATGRTVRVN